MSRSLIDMSTGEIITGVSRVITQSQEPSIEEYKKKKKLYTYMYARHGSFFFYKYDTLLEDIHDDVATAFRFLYVCSFADKNFHLVLSDGRLCNKKDHFTEIFQFPKSSSMGFLNKLLEYGLVYTDTEGTYRVNETYYAYGMPDDDFKQHSIRTFNRAVQDLYRRLSAKQHTFGGEFLKLVPYINIFNNTICKNIAKKNLDSEDIMTKEEIQEVLRPSSEYGKKLRLKLEKMIINDELLIAKFKAGDDIHYIVNPRFFYRGNDINDLRSLIAHFDISSNVTKQKRPMLRKGV